MTEQYSNSANHNDGNPNWPLGPDGKPLDTPEVRERVANIFKRTEEILEVPVDFKVLARTATHNGSSVRIDTAAEAEVRDTVNLGGVALNNGHRLPLKGAIGRYDDLVGRMLEDDKQGEVQTIAERHIDIAGQPSSALVYVTQRPQEGKLAVSDIEFQVARELPDGTRFIHRATVQQPSEWHGAVVEADRFVNERGNVVEQYEKAREIAEPFVPYDPTFPVSRPLHFEQIEQILG